MPVSPMTAATMPCTGTTEATTFGAGEGRGGHGKQGGKADGGKTHGVLLACYVIV